MSNKKLKAESYLLSGLNQKASPYLTPENEVLELENMHFTTAGCLTKRQGSSFYLGATVAGPINSLIGFERLNGSSFILASANTNLYNVTTSFSSIKSGLLNNGIFSFVTFVDRLFAANGQDFFKYDGSATDTYGLPAGLTSVGITAGFSSAITGLSGAFVAGYGYLNSRGYYGPVSPGVTLSLNGISFNTIVYSNLSVPSGYGITAIAFYRTLASGVQMFGTTLTPSAGAGATFVDVAPTGSRLASDSLAFTLAPQYLEIYNNQLVMAGFSSLPSTLYWSEIGEPEEVNAENFAEFRTNDGDVIRGIKSYLADLIVAKQRSVHKLSGEVPVNFSIQQITDQYGCLSHRTMVVFEDFLCWLDSKGVVLYNGTNIELLSEKIEPIFARMNVAAAKQTAIGVHNRPNNEIWFSFPVDGSASNNITIVYDYVSQAWTTYKGFNPTAFVLATGSLSMQSVMYGQTGSVHFFDESIENDNGNGITCVIQPRFISNMGQSTEQQFRRLFLNVEPIAGVTQPIAIELFKNYESAASATFTMYQAPFQSRIDFGLSAKTMSPKFYHNSATLSLKVFGFTVESRYQRAV